MAVDSTSQLDLIDTATPQNQLLPHSLPALARYAHGMGNFDYSLDYSQINFREQPELYRVGRGEQGVPWWKITRHALPSCFQIDDLSDDAAMPPEVRTTRYVASTTPSHSG